MNKIEVEAGLGDQICRSIKRQTLGEAYTFVLRSSKPWRSAESTRNDEGALFE